MNTNKRFYLIISLLIALCFINPTRADDVKTYINQSNQVINGILTVNPEIVINTDNNQTNEVQTEVNPND